MNIFNKKILYYSSLFPLFNVFVFRQSYIYIYRCVSAHTLFKVLEWNFKYSPPFFFVPAPMINCNSSSHVPEHVAHVLSIMRILLYDKILFSVLLFTTFDILKKGGNRQQIPGQFEWVFFNKI